MRLPWRSGTPTRARHAPENHPRHRSHQRHLVHHDDPPRRPAFMNSYYYRDGDRLPSEADKKRFDERWTPEPNSGCHIWDALMVSRGYGIFTFQGKRMLAHRFSFLRSGIDIPDTSLVCHRCDTPLCVNIAHLFLGDHAANAKDCIRKKRHCHGDKHKRANRKLTDEQVRHIWSIRWSEKGRIIADKYGVHRSTIFSIWGAKSYTHITKPSASFAAAGRFAG
jgi:hypothetical protein